MAKKTLQACRSHDDFVGYAKKRKAQIAPGGRHTLIYGPAGGMAPVPHHKGDLAKGTRYSIIKMFVAIGLAGMILLVLAI